MVSAIKLYKFNIILTIIQILNNKDKCSIYKEYK